MAFTIQKASKTQSRLRMTLDGPSGSGKTYTGLIFGTALAGGGRLGVIDTERGSASKYADMFDFDVIELYDNFSPQRYVEALHTFEQAGYSVILMDSLSHAWEGEGGVLDLHDAATTRQTTKNSYTAWRDVTPMHRELVDAILQSPAHIITTMRTKMEYVQERDESTGKTTVRKVGMAPVQRAGMEYEFDIVADMDTEHNLIVSKSRCFAVADAVVKKPGAEWFATVVQWLNSGAPAPVVAASKQAAPSATQPPLTAPSPSKFEWTNLERMALVEWLKKQAITDEQAKKLLGISRFSEFPGNREQLQAEILKRVGESAAQSALGQMEQENIPI